MNPTIFSCFIYILCAILSYNRLGGDHPITILSFILYCSSILHHSRPYMLCNHEFDFIRTFDIFIVVCISFSCIYYYHDSYLLWFSIAYTLFTYFGCINMCNEDFHGCLFHASIHIITGVTILYLVTNE